LESEVLNLGINH